MGVDAKKSLNVGPAVLLAGVGLGICLLLAVLVAGLMILPSLRTWQPALPQFNTPVPAAVLPSKRQASGTLQATPSELATMSAGDAVDHALGLPVSHPAISPPTGPTAEKSPAVPSHDSATDAASAAGPIRQTLPPPPGAASPAPVYAVEYAFFLNPDAATRFSTALAERGLSARLVEQRDEAGRNWIYVRSQVFTDAAMALAFAAKLEQSFGLSASLVTEPAIPPKEAAK